MTFCIGFVNRFYILISDNLYLSRYFLTKQDFINAIVNERRKELAFEGHRRMDLLRNGMALRSTGAAASISRPCLDPKVILPIPHREIDINPGMTGQQNVGY